MRKLIYGVGVYDADYSAQKCVYFGRSNGKQNRKVVWRCPFYQVWTSMLTRCYNDKYKLKQPSYKGVTVTDEWHLFSNFKVWMETQDWEGKQLDKDLLVRGNKIYSPETCIFVTRQVNVFLTDRSNDRGDLPIGVAFHKASGKFCANCSNPVTLKREWLGLFGCPEEAHRCWLSKKLEHAHTLAALQTDLRVAKALVDRYENYGM